LFGQTEIEKTVVRRRTVCENNTTINTEETEHEIMPRGWLFIQV